jgi:enolase
MKIRAVRALEILDSRGNPTLSVQVELQGGVWGEAKVPSGASTGKHEAVELRDAGGSVPTAAGNVDRKIAPMLAGMSAEDQSAVDRRMIELDGTPDKSRLGANAILGVSCAVARAAATAEGVPLWRRLAGQRAVSIPLPMINILSGGLHAGRHFEFQDFLAVPHGFATYSDSLYSAVAIHRAARELLEAKGYVLTGVADEGGWGPRLPSNESALDILTRAIAAAGFQPGSQVSIAIDAAATHFYTDGQYDLHSEGRSLTSAGMVELFCDWVGRYPVASIEDGLAEDDWNGWRALTEALGERVQLVGDDLFTTNIERLDRGIDEGVANTVLVKMNQIGTLTETFAVIDRARAAGYRAVISARSGETEDAFLADLAVASGAGQIKVGSITRSERLAKYNRLLEIERWDKLAFAGPFTKPSARHIGRSDRPGSAQPDRGR